eukprot:2141663-Rhodomonas_salina.1
MSLPVIPYLPPTSTALAPPPLPSTLPLDCLVLTPPAAGTDHGVLKREARTGVGSGGERLSLGVLLLLPRDPYRLSTLARKKKKKETAKKGAKADHRLGECQRRDSKVSRRIRGRGQEPYAEKRRGGG